jgi:hypothetical protein
MKLQLRKQGWLIMILCDRFMLRVTFDNILKKGTMLLWKTNLKNNQLLK